MAILIDNPRPKIMKKLFIWSIWSYWTINLPWS